MKIYVLMSFLWLSHLTFGQNRTTQDFNATWKFCKCDAISNSNSTFNDAAWDVVTTPHTWNALDGQDGGSNYFKGVGWYRKHFTPNSSFTGKRVFIKFNAVNLRSEVFINGNAVGTHVGGYSAFTYDITSLINLGVENVVAVKVNNSDTILAAPLEADFTFYGGITRNVELIIVDNAHISPLDFGSSGVYITQNNVSASQADINIKALVQNDYTTTKTITTNFYIKDAAGIIIKTLSSTASFITGELKAVTTNTTITNPILWNGLTNPYLYSVVTEIEIGGAIVDQIMQPLGIRYFSIDANQGFMLNGAPYKLHGVAHHEDRVDKGRAISDADRKQDLDILQEMGCTYLRLSHYQHGQYTYKYCDSVGIPVWTEIPMIDKVNGSQTFTNNAQQQLKELIRQNYNHPSVIVWGLSNEITYKSGPDPAPLVQILETTAKQEDATRLTVSAAMNSNAALNFYSDAYSCNVYNGWYYNTYNDFGAWADNQHTMYPTSKFGVSEYGAGANTNQHEPLNPIEPLNYGQWHPEEYQALFHEAHWKQMLARPYLWSTSVWVGFDFSSDTRNEGLQPGINDKGMVTRDRLVKKDAFYFYKANWSSVPFVYITSRRFTTRYDSVLTAKVYSNCDSVSFKVNTTKLTTQKSTNHIYQWTNVRLVRGLNTITSIGYKNGIAVNHDTCYWQFNGPYNITVAPAAIQINFETTATVTPAGYLKDAGNLYGDRGNGYTYGWNQNITTNARERNVEAIKTFDTFIHMQLNNGFNYWEIEVPNGEYRVSIVAGEANYFDSYNAISAEGKLIIQEAVYSSKHHAYGSSIVDVTDGKLTIRPATGSGASNAKIDFIHIDRISSTTGISDQSFEKRINVFPNPSNSMVSISPVREDATVRLIDATGKTIQVFAITKTDLYSFSIANVPRGIYLLEITSDSSQYITKVCIE